MCLCFNSLHRGSNDYGQLGNGSEAGTNSPVAVSGINNAKSISAGDVHTCALVEGGSAKCWGSNIYGELVGFKL